MTPGKLAHPFSASLPGVPANNAGYIGPAIVQSTSGRRVFVWLENSALSEPESDAASETEVELAFTFPYRPEPGDRLLVLGADDRYYAVGVLSGRAPTVLAFEGDVDLHAVGGTLTLAGDRGVDLEAPRVTIRAGVVRTIAGSLVEKADQAYRWVKGLIAIRAGESRRDVDGEDSTRCENSVTLAKDTVKIDGDQLHLGH